MFNPSFTPPPPPHEAVDCYFVETMKNQFFYV